MRPKNDKYLWNGCDKFVFEKCDEYGLVKRQRNWSCCNLLVFYNVLLKFYIIKFPRGDIMAQAKYRGKIRWRISAGMRARRGGGNL